MAGCQSCQSCQGCNRCQGCDDCEGVCDTCQSFCEVDNQYVGNFSFNQRVSAGNIFLTKNNWNRIISYINDAYEAGRECDAYSEYNIDSELPSTDPNDYMTADMFNKVSAAMNRLDSTKEKRIVYKGDVIYGSYFEELENYADYLKYKWEQCNRCNIYCNVSCDECEGCDSCEGCNGGSEAVYCCSSCNTCESDSPE